MPPSTAMASGIGKAISVGHRRKVTVWVFDNTNKTSSNRNGAAISHRSQVGMI